MTTECFNPVLDMMPRHGSQDLTRDDDAASDVNLNEMHYTSAFPFFTEPLGDFHSGNTRGHISEGQQNFHSQAGALGGVTDSYDSTPMVHMSWNGPPVDAQSYIMEASNPRTIQNPSFQDLLEQYLSRNSLEALPSPHSSVGTLVSDHPDRAQSVELRPSLSQISFPTSSGHSDIKDSSLYLTDAAFYPSSPYDTESHAYSESSCTDELESSMRPGFFHNGIANGITSHPGRLMPASTGPLFAALTSPDEVTLTSPMDPMSGQMYEISAPGNDFSLDPLSLNTNWCLDSPIDQGESRVSTPLSVDGIYPAVEATKGLSEFSSNLNGHSPSRTARRATVPLGGRIQEDRTAAHRRASHGSARVFESVPAPSRCHSRGSNEDESSPRSDPLYNISAPGSDGLYHCPWEKDLSCTHKPEKLKCNYDKFVDSHLKPYRCKIQACGNARFSSTACLLRHEREAHAMHGHGEKPFLCSSEGCERGTPGNGFPRHWNLMDHMKRVHNRSPSPSLKMQPRIKKRKNGSSVTSPSKKSFGKAELERQHFLSVLQDAVDVDPVAASQIMAMSTQALKSTITVPKIERSDSQQSSG